jgi:hypothetical protein
MADPLGGQADDVATRARQVKVKFAADQRNTPRGKPPVVADVAARLEAEFRQGVAKAIRQAHDADVPVPVLGDDGGIAWLHPDGVVRATRDAVRTGGEA